MRSIRIPLVLAFTVLLLSAGCSLHRSPLPDSVTGADIELTQTPFYPQQKYQCGPAALAMLLGSSGITATPDKLTPLLYIPERRGSLQLEIISGIRRHNRIPYEIKPDPSSLAGELRAGRPVLVLQNLGLKILPVYHYAVVIGIQRDGRILLRSGTTKRLVMDYWKFIKTWQKAGSWGVIALQPGELPTDHDDGRYLEAVAKLEAAGNPKLAEEGYTALLYRQPANEIALFGLANTLYAQQHYATAATCYKMLLARNPDHAEAANNLAESLAAMHCYSQAIELLDSFLCSGRTRTEMTAFLSGTRGEIQEKLRQAAGKTADCSATVDLSDM